GIPRCGRGRSPASPVPPWALRGGRDRTPGPAPRRRDAGSGASGSAPPRGRSAPASRFGRRSGGSRRVRRRHRSRNGPGPRGHRRGPARPPPLPGKAWLPAPARRAVSGRPWLPPSSPDPSPDVFSARRLLAGQPVRETSQGMPVSFGTLDNSQRQRAAPVASCSPQLQPRAAPAAGGLPQAVTGGRPAMRLHDIGLLLWTSLALVFALTTGGPFPWFLFYCLAGALVLSGLWAYHASRNVDCSA